MRDLKDMAQQVIARASRRGASAADVLVREDETFSVNVRMGEVETLKEAISRSLLLRIFIGNRTATARTSDLSSSQVERLVDETIEMARLTSEDGSGGLPDATVFSSDFPDLNLYDPSWEELTTDQRIDLARRAEETALRSDPAIVNSEGGSFDYTKSRTIVANTLGFTGAYDGTGASLGVGPIAQSAGGMQRDYWISATRHRRAMETPEEVGRKAAQRTLRRLGARKVSTCEVPVIFDPMTARSLISHIFQAVSGDAIYRRSSFLVDQIGQLVANNDVDIVDNARLPEGLGSSPFDDEGIPTQNTSIIDNGTLRNYLHTSYTARKLKSRPTGNGSRGMSGGVSIGPTNFYLKGGRYSEDEIIGSVRSGLYVIELIGFGVNTVSGDYSRGAVGMWIEDGKPSYPVQEVTIAGNLREMLKDIEMIGRDVLFLGSIASPALKIRKMVVSGE